jgi:hypothetical protein
MGNKYYLICEGEYITIYTPDNIEIACLCAPGVRELTALWDIVNELNRLIEND